MKKVKNTTIKNKRSSNRSVQTKSKKAKQLASEMWVTAIKRTWLVAVISLVSFTTLFSLLPKQTAESLVAKKALIYGDSVTMEPRFKVTEYSATKNGWSHIVRAWGGTAPCDWITWLPADLATYQPSIVAISTMGNISVTGCVNDGNGNQLTMGTQAYYDKYRADLSNFYQQVTSTGAKVVFLKAPPVQDTTRNNSLNQLHIIAQEIAGLYHGVSISPAVRNALSNNGKYTQYKNCLSTETSTQGCGLDGKIQIRSYDGLHLCPIVLAAYSTCNTYSSGEFRWSKAAVNATINPPAPILP
ncbi:MAG: hypothetical protein AAB459_03770 [Patescibacteria group bacterium]|jgi:hypothetical protein